MTKFDLFRELLALSYEADKVIVDQDDQGLIVTEPDHGDVLYHAKTIMKIADTCQLSSYVTHLGVLQIRIYG
jgi:hypothetical protein